MIAFFQSTPVGGQGGPGMALAAATCSLEKKREVLFDLGWVGIAAGDYVWALVSIGPDHEDDATTPESQALKALFTVVRTIIFLG
jgi:hypothetical protein